MAWRGVGVELYFVENELENQTSERGERRDSRRLRVVCCSACVVRVACVLLRLRVRFRVRVSRRVLVRSSSDRAVLCAPPSVSLDAINSLESTYLREHDAVLCTHGLRCGHRGKCTCVPFQNTHDRSAVGQPLS